MNANTSSSELVHQAYRLLKQETYYDKMNLFLRANVATYKASDSFQKQQYALATIIDELCKGTPNLKWGGWHNERKVQGEIRSLPAGRQYHVH